MHKTMLAAALVAASTAAPAFAQDDRPFHGPWVGASVGYDNFSAGEDGTDDDGSEDGVAYGVAFGYDYNFGGVVVGAEAEIGDSSVAATATDFLVAGDEFRLAAGRDLYAGLRIGVPVSDKVLIYGKGGYTNQRFKATYTDATGTESFADNVDGFRLGAGVELDLGQPFARLEYRYSDYGSFSDSDIETSRHQLMLTAGIRF